MSKVFKLHGKEIRSPMDIVRMYQEQERYIYTKDKEPRELYNVASGSGRGVKGTNKGGNNNAQWKGEKGKSGYYNQGKGYQAQRPGPYGKGKGKYNQQRQFYKGKDNYDPSRSKSSYVAPQKGGKQGSKGYGAAQRGADHYLMGIMREVAPQLARKLNIEEEVLWEMQAARRYCILYGTTYTFSPTSGR